MNKHLLAILMGMALIIAFNTATAQYEESLTIPTYDSQNSEMALIEPNSNFASQLNDENKRIFFIKPGDYSGYGRVTLRESGTAQAPKWMIYYDPANPNDNTHPVDMASNKLATFGRINIEAPYWNIHRIRAIGDNTRSPNITAADTHIVIDNCLFERGGGGAGQVALGRKESNYPSADYGVVQFCVIRNTQISPGDDNHGLKLTKAKYNRIIHNEFYNSAGDNIQFGPDQPFEGTVVYDNDFYIDPSMHYLNVSEVPHENSIDFKNGGGSAAGDHILIKGNRFRNMSHTPGGTSANNHIQGAIDFSEKGQYKSYILIEENVFFDCRLSICSVGGDRTSHITIRKNLIYKSERHAIYLPKINLELNHDIYLNTIIDVLDDGVKQRWMETRIEDSRIEGNLVIDGGGVLSDAPSGTISNYNAYYNTSELSFEGNNSNHYTADSEQTDYVFYMGMFTGAKQYIVPGALPTTSSPHYNMTQGITFGNHSGVGHASEAVTQSTPGAFDIGGGGGGSNGTPPSAVSITSHSQDEEVSSTETLTATASDIDDDLAGIQFKIDGVLVGSEDTTSPFTYSWNTSNETEGAHTVQAVARDDNDNYGYSPTITVIVDNVASTAPTISFTAPINNDTISGPQCFTVSASDSDGDLETVQYQLDGVNIGSPVGHPYSICWNSTSVENGTYSLKAIATDSEGLTNSATISVTVDNEPSPCVILPNNNIWVNTSIASQSSNFTISFNVTPSHAGVNTEFGVSDGDASSINDLAAVVRFKTNNINARDGNASYPASGLNYVAGVSYFIEMEIDLTNHTYDVYVTPEDESRIHLADDYDFHSNSSSITSIDRLPGKLLTTSSGRQIDICYIQVDGTGTPSSSPPTVSISAPADGATVSGTSQTITAIANDVDDDLTGVQFKLNGTNLGSQDTSSPFTYSWNTTNHTNGQYALEAVATDDEGQSVSTSILVTISNNTGGSSPTISFDSPSNSATVSGTNELIQVSTSDADGDIVSVQYKLDGTNIGSAVTQAPYSLSWNTVNHSDGAHTLSAEITDAADNSSTASISVTISNSSSSCVTLPNNNTWVNTTLSTQSSDFTVEFDVTPSHSGVNSEFGVSDGNVSSLNDVAALIRFKTNNINARDGNGSYPVSGIKYIAGVTYHIEMEIDLTNHTFDAYVTPDGSTRQQLADDFDFHSNSSSITSINRLPGKLLTTSTDRQVDICNITVSSSGSRQAEETTVEEMILADHKLSVYPNPVANFVKISASDMDLSGSFSIRSISGSVISHGSLSGKLFEIYTGQLPSGVYILDVRLAGEEPKAIRIIKD
ncbi:MAG: Ig-like domain-containing protein [Cyclobacteriaceae bacterium]